VYRPAGSRPRVDARRQRTLLHCMSFRARLTLFFVLIVVVPMVSVAFLLFRLIGGIENGKQDAALSARQGAAIALQREFRTAADRVASVIGRDPQVAAALRAGGVPALRARVDELRRREGATRVVIARDGRVLTDVGDPKAVLPATRQLVDKGARDVGRLQVSTVTARGYADRTARLTTDEVVVRRDGEVLATTLPRAAAVRLPDRGGEVTVGGQDYHAFTTASPDFGNARLLVTLLDPGAAQATDARNSRILTAAILLGFFILACTFAVMVSRSLNARITSLLQAARRLAGGDFGAKVPTQGRDEFAALGEEFNKMSAMLSSRVEDLKEERKRLRDAMRRVGDTFASSLDRQRLLAIAVQTTVDGVDADAGRASLRGGDGADDAAVAGVLDGLEGAIRAAEAGALESGRPTEVTVGDVRALAHPLPGGAGPAGAVAVARRGRPFTEPERELFHYLAGQAAVSLENVGLHEMVERQAVTDELTGLSNRRRFDEILDAEVERARRFGQPLGLVLLDLDDFKAINDTFGHQVGDDVLREVSRVLRNSCREIDEPARYGGEELAVVLPGTDLEGAERFAERVRRGVAALRVPLGNGAAPVHVTSSLGVATLPGTAYDARSLVEAADDALYRAKRTGKNRTVVAA
jgi:diguanylate cyclase (GGDEF)-like protein